MKQLYLMQTKPDLRLLAVWAQRHDLLREQDEPGYALHALLRAAFGDYAPKPFRYLDARQGLLAYTNSSPEEVQAQVALADPEVAAALGLMATAEHGGVGLRALPQYWPLGHLLGFEVRARPVVRQAANRRELDAFLAAVEASHGASVDRNEVYLQWFREQLGIGHESQSQPWHGAVDLVEVTINRFRLQEVMRRTQISEEEGKRRRRTVSGPDVVFAGTLRIRDSERFGRLLERGVGRHRSFGYGMMLVRPAN